MGTLKGISSGSIVSNVSVRNKGRRFRILSIMGSSSTPSLRTSRSQSRYLNHKINSLRHRLSTVCWRNPGRTLLKDRNLVLRYCLLPRNRTRRNAPIVQEGASNLQILRVASGTTSEEVHGHQIQLNDRRSA